MSQARTVRYVWGGRVVDHHDMHLAAAKAGGGDLLEEGQWRRWVVRASVTPPVVTFSTATSMVVRRRTQSKLADSEWRRRPAAC